MDRTSSRTDPAPAKDDDRTARLKIRIIGDPVLRQEAEPVEEFGEELEKFAWEMVETMIAGDGIGLAAPQVGVSKRFLVMGMPVEEDENKRRIFLIANPKIIEKSEETTKIEEGCLSIPTITEEVVRPEKVKVVFQDLHGKEHLVEADGVFARVIQHEIDHLDGILFIDRLSPLKRRLLRSKIQRVQEEYADSENEA